MNTDNRAAVGLAMLAHMIFHACELSIPVFVITWLETFAVSKAKLGLITGVGYALVGLGAVPAGLLADNRGSKLPVELSMLGMGVGFLVLGFAPDIAVVALALAIWGAAASLYHPAGLSLLSRGTTQRGSAFAYHGAAGNVGTVVGPFAAILLLSLYGWRVAAVMFAVPAVAGTFLAWHIDIESKAVGDCDVATNGGTNKRGTPTAVSEFAATSRRLFSGAFAIVFVIVMVYGLYYRGILTFLPRILSGLAVFEPVPVFGWSVDSSRYVYTMLLLVGVFGQYAGGKLISIIKVDRALTCSFVVLAIVALAFLPASRMGVIPMVTVCTILGFFLYLTAPIYQATIATYVESDNHGLSYGYTYLGMFGVGALGATVAGATLTYAGPSMLFLTLGGFASISFILSLLLIIRD